MKIKKTLTEIIAKHTGLKFDKVSQDMERNKWIMSDEALKYGLIDKIIS